MAEQTVGAKGEDRGHATMPTQVPNVLSHGSRSQRLPPSPTIEKQPAGYANTTATRDDEAASSQFFVRTFLFKRVFFFVNLFRIQSWLSSKEEFEFYPKFL